MSFYSPNRVIFLLISIGGGSVIALARIPTQTKYAIAPACNQVMAEDEICVS
ncbi:hypothetical protein H6F96_27350 [Microcoleus sp. FACHB-53]|nr:hypothetical protein [Microcoleus sp. FACHB-53]MBD2126470.1 hypothetical protein [Microcoleus sp. FACHB-1]